MVNEAMYARGAESSVIREIFSYANERKAQVGAEHVFDFSLGNPSVPAPDAVRASIERSLTLPPEVLHGYTPAPGMPEARQAVADINGVENFDARKEVAGETDAERFARNWTAMEFLKDNAVYK